MVYSVLFNPVIEALTLICEKYLTEIQLPGNITQLLSIPQSSTCIFAQTMAMGMASPFKLPSQYKTCSLALFLKLIWARWLSLLGLSRLYYRNPCTLSRVKIREKWGVVCLQSPWYSHLYFGLVTARSASCQRTIGTVYVPGSDKSL
jgi:hypothetical protein